MMSIYPVCLYVSISRVNVFLCLNNQYVPALKGDHRRGAPLRQEG